MRARGQAFVIFEHSISAEQALYEQNNQYIFGKPMLV
jgi:hypothetical protein